MKRIIPLLALVLMLNAVNAQNSGNPSECDSVDIVSVHYNPFDMGQLLVHVQNNNQQEIFDYPGFKLLNTTNDTVAAEMVNFFGISAESVHHLNTTLTGYLPGDVFSGELLLYSNFYDSLRCIFPVSEELVPDEGCTEFYISTTDWSENIMQSIYWTITDEDGSVVETGEHDHTIQDYTLYDTICLPNNNCYTLNISADNPLEGNSDITITYLGFWVSEGSQMAQGSTQYSRNFSVYYCDSLLSVGQVEAQSQKVNVTPNPIVDQLNISWEGKASYHTMEVFDIEGRKVRAEAINTQRLAILHLEELQSGVYTLRLTGDEGVVTRKFVKNGR